VRIFRAERARVMHLIQCMAHTAQFPDIHTQAGARWLAPFSTIVLATLIAALVMFIYPYVAR
jgi:hypothetical protein